MSPLLLILIPLLSAVAVALAPRAAAFRVATISTLITLAVSLIIASDFGHWYDDGFGLVTELAWLPSIGASFDMHADAPAMWLVLLSTVLMPICVIGSKTAIKERVREYYAWLLVLEAAMLGVFLAKNLLFFYVAFEFTLVPMYFLIAGWGGSNRASASIKFFLYTFTGSMLTLAGLAYVAWRFADASGGWSFDIPALTAFASVDLSATEQFWVMMAMLAGFAVKVPLFPVHTWLPLAHTEAPTAGSVVLAGVLLKLGTYGLFRFVLPMTPVGVVEAVPAIGALATIGVIYGALICWVQEDVKKLVAYSSVSHLGFCVLGLFALNPSGLQGSILYMINHGLSTGALFLLIGMIYERYHTRDMNRLGGLVATMPIWSAFMVFFVLSSLAVPGLNGFVSEFLCLIGAFSATPDNAQWPGLLGPWYAVFAGTGMILAAMYLLYLTGRLVWGAFRAPPADENSGLPTDLSPREIGLLLPLAAMCVWLGVQPSGLMRTLEPSVERTLAAYPELVPTQVESVAVLEEVNGG